jgi:hypothetical protein
VWFLGADQAIKDSVIKGVHAIVPTGDCVGVIFWNTCDRGLVDNCEIEGSTESVMMGGMDINPYPLTRVPTDITVRRSRFSSAPYQRYYDPSFIDVHWNTKNLGETKAGRRVAWIGNVFANCISQDQQFTLTIKSNIGNGQATQHAADIVVQHAKLIDCMAGVQARGFDADPESAALNRIVFDNLAMLGVRDVWPSRGINARLLQFQDFGNEIEVSRMTAFIPWADRAAMTTGPEEPGRTLSNVRVRDSILGGAFGIGYAGEPWGGLHPSVTGERTVARLGLIDASSATTYGNASNVRVANTAAAQFVSYANSASDNMRLQSGSPFKGIGVGGADPGADHDALDFETRGCVSGVWS